MTQPDVLSQQGAGSTDWSGGIAPAGGTHTGTSTILMASGSQYVVAHDLAEILQKRSAAPVAPPQSSQPFWIAFDQPNQPTPIVLNVRNMVSVIANGRTTILPPI